MIGVFDGVRGVKVVLRALGPASSLPLPRPLLRVDVLRPPLLRVDVLDRPTRPRWVVVRVVERPVLVPRLLAERPTLPRDGTVRPVVVPLLRPVARGAVVPRVDVLLCTPLERAVTPRALRVAELLRPIVAPRG